MPLPKSTIDEVNTATASYGIASHQGYTHSPLLKLPNEIKQRIFTLAVTEDDPITPWQIKPKSNKFVWSKAQFTTQHGHVSKISIGAVPQLVAVQLSKVCREIYKQVALTNLFYQVNVFDFSFNRNMVNYLVAITHARMMAIRSVKILLVEGYRVKHNAQRYALLQACEGLQRVNAVLNLHYAVEYLGGSHYARKDYTIWDGIIGHRHLLAALFGVKHIEITLEYVDLRTGGISSNFMNAYKKAQACLPAVTAALQSKVKDAGYISLDLNSLRDAQQSADLHVHGEGRLGEDKMPGIVASRTRSAIRRTKSLNADGTLPPRIAPKYDADGDLVWNIVKILESRESFEDDETPSVEFKIEIEPSTGRSRSYEGVLAGTTISWENLSVLKSDRAMARIALYYECNVDAPGLQAVAEFFDRSDVNKWAWKSLKRAIELRDRKLEQEALEAAKLKAIADKKAAKDKKALQGRKNKSADGVKKTKKAKVIARPKN